MKFDDWWAQFQRETPTLVILAKAGDPDAVELLVKSAYLGGYEQAMARAKEIIAGAKK